MSLDNVKYYIKSITTNYVVALFIVCGISLLLFYATTNPRKEFLKETKLAKFSGFIYLLIGIALFIRNLLI